MPESMTPSSPAVAPPSSRGVSAALSLVVAYVVLIVYASLYPFSDWVDVGVPPFAFLAEEWPRYWIWSDLIFNVVGYLPLGALLVIWLQRDGKRGGWVILPAVVAVSALSLTLETLQNYLPLRVASNVDWALNTSGALMGAVLGDLLRRWGWLAWWNGLRDRWFNDDAHGALLLLAGWPAALLFPAAVPFGVGQVFERLSLTLAQWVQDSAYADWFPLTRMDLESLPRLTQAIAVGLGLLLPLLLGYSIVRTGLRRLMLMPLVFIVGLGMLALSAALSYGPVHAAVWLTDTTLVGVLLALGLGIAAAWLPCRLCLLAMLLALGLHLSIINQAPTSPYLAETLQVWERGQFIHFQGLAQWVGWLWPYVALLYVLRRLAARAVVAGDDGSEWTEAQ